MGHLGYCEFCGVRAPVAAVHYRQNTGMLVVRQSREWAGNACRDCGKSWFWKASIHTFFLGWWGTISFVLTPIFLIANIYNYVGVLRLQTLEATNRARLEDQRDYALNLLRSKDQATVIDVIARASGADVAEVETFVGRLQQESRPV